MLINATYSRAADPVGEVEDREEGAFGAGGRSSAVRSTSGHTFNYAKRSAAAEGSPLDGLSVAGRSHQREDWYQKTFNRALRVTLDTLPVAENAAPSQETPLDAL
ncbi:hypothetical protein KM043_002237 [Ampulex compressa]|nr:hypothetical protein KM043_002237 [Ampulex compressa]